MQSVKLVVELPERAKLTAELYELSKDYGMFPHLRPNPTIRELTLEVKRLNALRNVRYIAEIDRLIATYLPGEPTKLGPNPSWSELETRMTDLCMIMIRRRATSMSQAKLPQWRRMLLLALLSVSLLVLSKYVLQ